MRSYDLGGRFRIDYEMQSIQEGMTEELGNKVGQTVNWFRWQEWYKEENFDTMADDIYDVSSNVYGGGRRWMLPIRVPVLMAQLTHGGNQLNDRGFYIADNLRLLVNSGDVEPLLPEITRDEPGNFIKDRIVYRNQVFTPTRVTPRGAVGNYFAVVTVECNEVNSEELVNDPQFVRFAEQAQVLQRSNNG